VDINFPYALNRLLEVEGGVSNDANDHGGLTNKGITQKEYDAYRIKKTLPIQSVTLLSSTEFHDIYYNNYWLVAQCDKLKTGVDTIHFDMAVNAGPKQAAKLLQRAIGVTDDGIIGPQTLERVNVLDPTVMVKNYVGKRVDFYIDLCVADVTQLKFLKGWIRRAIAFCNK